MKQYRVQLIDNSIHILSGTTDERGQDTDRALIGLGPFLAQEDKVEITSTLNFDGPIIVLTHNPDTVDRLPLDTVDLVLAGHTHGGQIRIPYIYNFFIPTQGEYDKGFHAHPHADLFVSSGIGASILPLRM